MFGRKRIAAELKKPKDFISITVEMFELLDEGDIRERSGPLQNEWLTANEAAEYLKVEPRTVLRWARERKIPAHPLGGTKRRIWRFLRAELDAMLGVSSAGPADGRQH